MPPSSTGTYVAPPRDPTLPSTPDPNVPAVYPLLQLQYALSLSSLPGLTLDGFYAIFTADVAECVRRLAGESSAAGEPD
jgi:hypothetical protein